MQIDMQATRATVHAGSSINSRRGYHRQLTSTTSRRRRSLICVKCLNIGIRQLWPTRSKPYDRIHRQREFSCSSGIGRIAVPMAMPLVSPITWILPSFADGWPLWTLLLVCAALGQVCAGQRQQLLQVDTLPVLAVQ